MSLNFLGGGVGGYTLVNCHTLRTGELLEELLKMVSSREVKLCKYGGDANGGD